MLELAGMEAGYGKIKVLQGVNLTVNRGEITCLLGSNGAGKTTTIRTILGLLRPTAGRVTLAGEDVTALPTPERIRRGLAVVPEGRRVFPKLSVHENLLLGAALMREARRVAANLERVYGLFPRLRERTRQAAGTLSGGEQQMLAMGRALMSDPQVLLLDEPSLGLAPILIREVFRLIQEINAGGTTVLLIEQNAFQALAIAHRAYVLQKGRVVEELDARNPVNREALRQAYLSQRGRADAVRPAAAQGGAAR